MAHREMARDPSEQYKLNRHPRVRTLALEPLNQPVYVHQKLWVVSERVEKDLRKRSA